MQDKRDGVDRVPHDDFGGVVVVVVVVVVYCSASTSQKRSELRGAERAATLFKRGGGGSFGSEGATSCNYCVSNLYRNCLLPFSVCCCASEQARPMEWLLPPGPCSMKFEAS